MKRVIAAAMGRIIVGAVLWTCASTGAATAGGTIIALAWLGASRPVADLIVLTLTNMAAILLLSLIWPLRPQLTWALSEWLLFSGISALVIFVIYTYGLPWYLHGLPS